MQMTDQQVAQAYRQGMPVESIAHMLSTSEEEIEKALSREGICVKCQG
jgi:DNA-binding NarL/FixJ family response regulator